MGVCTVDPSHLTQKSYGEVQLSELIFDLFGLILINVIELSNFFDHPVGLRVMFVLFEDEVLVVEFVVVFVEFVVVFVEFVEFVVVFVEFVVLDCKYLTVFNKSERFDWKRGIFVGTIII